MPINLLSKNQEITICIKYQAKPNPLPIAPHKLHQYLYSLTVQIRNGAAY